MLAGDIARTRVAEDGRFALGGLQGARRIRLYQAPAGWQLRSVQVNGADVTDEALPFGTARESLSNVRIVLTQQGPLLTGRATDDQGHDVRDYNVVAFSTDAELRYQRSRFMGTTRGRADGSFSISSLAPGEYYVVAVNSLLNAEGWGEWQDPDFLLKMAAGAARVTLANGQTAAVNLKITIR
jgi:hypothetical protein